MRIKLILIFSSLFIMTGCWDQYELTELGFVIAATLDEGEEDAIKLTLQVYKPSGDDTGVEQFHISTEADNVYDATRDFVIHLGRKTNWSHMQSIILSEDLVKAKAIDELLDFFYRDIEPRSTVNVVIGEGEGRDFLNFEPLIESTVGRQIREGQRQGHQLSGKSIDTTLFDLSLEMKSEVNDTYIPYIIPDHTNKTAPMNGVVLLKDGQMTTHISGEETQYLIMLKDQFKTGVIKIPLLGNSQGEEEEKMESLKVLSQETNRDVHIEGQHISVKITSELDVILGEIFQTKLETEEEKEQYVQYIERIVEERLELMIERLQEEKIDPINMGNQIYRENPTEWKTLKEDWRENFANIEFEVDVDINIITSGFFQSKPFLSE
ncbi:Ger(x)C family spore germination protein [Bacillus shivajii]|uniref:Ger(x)C family spore germination protein n=1 Tax=Bacillus shivajii TaxID=1983719 RepID=UPI001CFA9CC6|nr:Ger(x)C family spore germination protein [Bacillus shivajii]UCZ52111.1 Ger(x)C family spore germination protein [Bacillus shivajii]